MWRILIKFVTSKYRLSNILNIIFCWWFEATASQRGAVNLGFLIGSCTEKVQKVIKGLLVLVSQRKLSLIINNLSLRPLFLPVNGRPHQQTGKGELNVQTYEIIRSFTTWKKGLLSKYRILFRSFQAVRIYIFVCFQLHYQHWQR